MQTSNEVQEHCINLQDPNNKGYRTIGSSFYLFFFIIPSGRRYYAQASQGKMGALISKRAYRTLLDAKRITNRILRVEFDGNLKTTVLIMYSPTNAAEQSAVVILQGSKKHAPGHTSTQLCHNSW
ncbi:AP1 endonuclease [Elysia marginata]|uniref:AP1 endonuclease n=1 Tax=Elysia marginata TaxID=1093978 RepID=A0AAV4EPS0_9GAST|nr:AP1 endonuclease [Elysia marginata]